MNPRLALGLAVAAAGLAIALVAADVAWGLQMRVQERDGAGWSTVVRNDGDWTYRSECAIGPDLRLVLDNDQPFAQSVAYRVTWFDPASSRTMEATAGERRLDAFATSEVEFTLPASAFQDRGLEAGMANLEVRADDLSIHLCVLEGTS